MPPNSGWLSLGSDQVLSPEAVPAAIIFSKTSTTFGSKALPFCSRMWSSACWSLHAAQQRPQHRIAGEVGNKEEETKESKPLITKKPAAKNERVYNKPSIPDKKVSHNRLNDEHIVHMKKNGNGHGNGKKTPAVSDADEIFPIEKAFKDF